MNKWLFSLFFLCIIIVSSSNIISVGIQQPPSEERLIIFQPNLVKTYGFTLVNAPRIHSYVFSADESLYNYVELDDPAQDTGPRGITATIRLPETLAPGRYDIFIGGSELAENQGTIGAVAAIQSKIEILSLYPGKDPQFTFGSEDIAVNGSGNMTLNVDNYGTEKIDAAYGVIEVFDVDGNKITTLTTDSKPVDSKMSTSTSVQLHAVFKPSLYSLKPGIYNASAKLYYDGAVLPESQAGSFRIGSLLIKIDDWTKKVIINATNSFKLTIESDWVSPIENVYAKITTPNHGIIKTPNLDVSTFQQSTLETYWETDGLDLKTYDLPVEIFYDGKSTSQVLQVDVAEGVAPIIEKPKNQGFSITLNTTTIVIIAMILLILVNLYFLFIRKKSSEPAVNQSIKPPKL